MTEPERYSWRLGLDPATDVMTLALTRARDGRVTVIEKDTSHLSGFVTDRRCRPRDG